MDELIVPHSEPSIVPTNATPMNGTSKREKEDDYGDKITKPGKKSEPIHFECKHCGCIFETDVVSMRHIWLRPDYFATCPNCHRLCCTDGDER